MAFRPRHRIRTRPSYYTAPSFRSAPSQRCKYATAAAIAPAPPSPAENDGSATTTVAIERFLPNQPPSFKPPDLRKSQLLRQYISLLRSTPLNIFFQHNSLKANEWAAIRRELAAALRKVSSSATDPQTPNSPDPADSIRLQIIQTAMFGVALRIHEFYDPLAAAPAEQRHDPTAPIHATAQASTTPTHALSRAAYEATLTPSALLRQQNSSGKYNTSMRAHTKRNTPLNHLMHGPIAALSFPTMSPQHLAAALCILAPTPGANSAFPAPRRKAAPGYFDPAVQNGLQKLLLLGARVDGRAMDGEGVRWIGSLAASGGLEGLRAQLVQMLQSVGANVTGTLESAGKSLWVTMESRRVSLAGDEDKDKGEVP